MKEDPWRLKSPSKSRSRTMDPQLQKDIQNMDDVQQDILFTMLVSAATGADPWSTEDALYERGIIHNTSKTWNRD